MELNEEADLFLSASGRGAGL